MKTISFTDESRTELTSHINTNDKGVICLEQDGNLLVYVFEDEHEIDEYINHLKEVKSDLAYINNVLKNG